MMGFWSRIFFFSVSRCSAQKSKPLAIAGSDFSGSFSLQFCDHHCDQRVPSTLAVIAQPIFSVAVASTPERPVLAELGSQCLGF
jgi:hypothetical protein